MRHINRIKRVIRKVTGWGEIFEHAVWPNGKGRSSCIFYYHRAADIAFRDPLVDDRNVPPALLEKQLSALLEFAEVVPVAELANGRGTHGKAGSKSRVAITFDDGYANFRSNVLPLLIRYQIPATLTVVTGYVGSRDPAPFDRWASRNRAKASPEAWRLLTWKELDQCVDSGLVNLGAHSHTHPKANECTPARLADEAARSAEILRERFGPEHAQVYAYPFGSSVLGHVSDIYENTVRSAGYSIGLSTDVGMVSAKSNILRLPRIEAHDQDTPATLRAKSAGAIAPLYLNRSFHRVLAWRTKNRIEGEASALKQQPNEQQYCHPGSGSE